MSDLTDFLLARITEDERLALEDIYLPVWVNPRVLAECDAKRRIIEAMVAPQFLLQVDAIRVAELARLVVLGNLALPYADHPDYREEWRL